MIGGAVARALLGLAPAGFRARYGADLLDASASRVAAARRRGRGGREQLRELAGLLVLVLKLRIAAVAGRGAAEGARPSRPAESVLRDVRYGARALRRDPAYALAGVLVLALGIGASVAIFSAANAFLLRPLPFADADRLVMLYETNPEFGWTDETAAPANMLDWRERVRSFEDVASFSEFAERIAWVGGGTPHMLAATAVTGNFFSTLGVRPTLGRGFTWEETWQGSSDVVVLSHALWERHFGSDAAVVGSTIEFGTRRMRVVGVMPPGFSFPSAQTELWLPWGWERGAVSETWFRRAHFVRAFARLRHDATPERAAAELEQVTAELQAEYPGTNRVMGAGMMPLREFLVRDVARPLHVLLGAVTLLLLLACANVANLTMVRGAARTRELALRHALGADRTRVVTQLLTESAVLAAAGGALGVFVGWGAVRAMESLTRIGIDGATTIALDHRVALFACVTTMLSALLFGVVPALRSTSGRLQGALTDGGTGASAGRARLRTVRALVAVEVALAVMLVAAAALMTRSFVLMRSVDPGFRTEGVLAVHITAPAARYAERDAVLAFQDRVVESLEARAGIEAVGIVAQLPLAGTSWSSQFQARGWPPERVGLEVLHRRADAGYFDVLGIPLLKGRMWDERDGPDAPLAVLINATFAREHFGDEDPVGQWIAFDRAATDSSVWHQVIGIVADQHQESPARAARAEVFEHRRQDWARSGWYVVRTARPSAALDVVRATLRDIDPLIAIGQTQTLREVWRASMEREQFVLTLLGVFGAAALLLAAVGVYAVTAQAARGRTREIGIRLALGAEAGRVMKLLLGQSLVIVMIGVAAGLVCALAAGRALAGMLFGVTPSDPLTLSAVAALLMGTAAAACYLPVRRALRADPLRALRADQP
jgi:putative ABC transport system permease protein